MRKYDGPPQYADVPLTGRDKLEVGLRDVPFVEALDVRGAEALSPFPATVPCPPERVPQRTSCVPNNPLVAERGLRIFSQYSELDVGGEVIPTTPQLETYQFLRSPIPLKKSDLGEDVEGENTAAKLWIIELWGYEIARNVAALAGPVSPTSAIIPDNNVNGGSQMTRLKARINMHGASGGSTRVVDIGEGIRFAIEACQVQVDVLYPVGGAVQVAGNNSLQLAPAGGLVLDSFVGGFITETSSVPGAQVTTNTITRLVPANSANDAVFVPPGTHEVDIYQTGAGSLMVPEWRLLRDPADPGPSLGQIILGGSRRVTGLVRPGNAGMITSGSADPLVDRVVTYVFRGEI